MLFADGAAAVLVTGDDHPIKGLHIDHFYSEVIPKGKKDMAWEIVFKWFSDDIKRLYSRTDRRRF